MNEHAPPTPDPAPESALSGRVDFPCRNCGGKLVWDPDADALACEHCAERVAVPRAEDRIVERPLEAAGDAARGLGLDQRALRCNNCGATVELAHSATAECCAFCGSANVLAREANRNLLRPESLIPLDVGRADVERSFRAWIRGLWFRPNALQRIREFGALGIYVPYWTFDCQVHSEWSADAGYIYYETVMTPVMVNGKVRMQPRQVQRIRWVPAWGARDDVYDDLLVHASKGIPRALAQELGDFDTRALVPYRPEYLAGWHAEEYQVDLEQAWQLAREDVVARQRARCARDVPGDTHRDLRVQNALRDVRWKHILLPMWSLTYTYGGKPYAVLVHGQTGRVHGRAPLSWVKIVLLVLGLLATLVVVLALAALTAGH